MKEVEFKETDDGKKVIEMKPLYGLTSKGKTKIWTVTIVENSDGTAAIIQKYGEYGGKQQENIKNVREGKNLGKKNSTTAFQQACKEAESKWTKKKDQEGYAEDKDNLSIPLLPMLAKSYLEHKSKVTFPCMLQEKMDGLRCLVTKVNGDTIKYASRKGKEFTSLSHLTPQLLEIMDIDECWDGELFCRSLSFQDITSAVKAKKENTAKIELWIYDVVDSEMDFKDRYKRYNSASDKAGIVKVKTYEAKNEEEIYKYHEAFVKDGKEGTIIRSSSGGYEIKKRSDRLLKLKSFDDAEFQVISGYEGTGSAEGHATFICITKDNKEFGCVMRGSHEFRASLWKNLDKIVAAKSFITIQYFGLTDGGLPRFPTGICFREGGINKDGVFEPDI